MTPGELLFGQFGRRLDIDVDAEIVAVRGGVGEPAVAGGVEHEIRHGEPRYDDVGAAAEQAASESESESESVTVVANGVMVRMVVSSVESKKWGCVGSRRRGVPSNAPPTAAT